MTFLTTPIAGEREETGIYEEKVSYVCVHTLSFIGLNFPTPF